MPYQLHQRATPNFFTYFKLSIYPSIHLAVFFSVNLSIDLFHSLNINIIAADPGAGIGLVLLHGQLLGRKVVVVCLQLMFSIMNPNQPSVGF